MISCEEYELSYNLYREGKILTATESSLELLSLTESSEYVEEGAKENIRSYVTKVVNGIQKVWTKFKDNVQKAKLDWSIEDIQKAIANNAVNVNVEGYIEYNPQTLQSVNLIEFNYQTMESSLGTKEDFMKKYYGSTFYIDSAKSIVDNLRNKCITRKVDKYALTKEDLQKMLDYMKTHKDFLDKVSKDLDKVNAAAKSAETAATITSNAPTAAPAPNNESAVYNNYLSYYLEDDAPKVSSSEEGESNNDTTSTGTEGGTSEKKDNGDAEKTKKIQMYFKCISEILTAEMTISREIYKFYSTCISTHMKNVRNKNKDQDNKPNEGGAKATNDGPAQVDTSV